MSRAAGGKRKRQPFSNYAWPQVLALPDFSKQFFIFTDASLVGMGAVLAQLDDAGHYRPILFLSRKWNGAERNYSATEREALSFITAVTKCRYYLFGRRFTVITDASALKSIYGHGPLVDNQGIPKQAPRVARWALLLSNYEFDVIHCPGKRMVVADYLSRLDGATADSADVESSFANPWKASAWSFQRAPNSDASRESTGLSTFLESPTDWSPEYVHALQMEDPLIGAILDFVERRVSLDQARACVWHLLIRVAPPINNFRLYLTIGVASTLTSS
jgi:hypothetical protein